MAKNNNRNYHSNQTPPAKAPEAKAPAYEFEAYYASNPLANSAVFGLSILDIYDQNTINSVVKEPMTESNNKILRKVSNIMYGTNGVLSNTIDYMTSMPTLDKVIVTHGSSKAKKKRNKQLMDSTLRTIKDKEFLRDALHKGYIDGTAIYYFEATKMPIDRTREFDDLEVRSITELNDAGINASIIPLPIDYTRIIGRKNNVYKVAFDLDYFVYEKNYIDQDRLVKCFPKEIREAWNVYKNGKRKNWVVLNENNTIVHKIRSKIEEPFGRPLALPAILDILYADYFTQTKRHVLDEINNRVIYQTFPEGKEKGTSALTKVQQQKQHETVRDAVMNKNKRGGTSFFSVAAGTKISTVDPVNTDIFDDKYESNMNDRISLDLGIASSLLNGSGSGNYSSQTQNLELITSQIFEYIEQIASELNKCIQKNIIRDKNNWVEVRYLPITSVNKTNMVNNTKELYLQGKGSLTLWASAVGIQQDVFYALLDQELEEDIENKYPVHQTSFTLSPNSSESDEGGRPTTDNPTENTVASRANGGNNIPSPSDNK